MLLALGLGVLGFVAMKRAHRWSRGCGYRDGWHGGWRRHHHGHDPFGRRPWFLYSALARLDATPAQERAIVGEIDRMSDRVAEARTGMREVREDLAAAVRGPQLDDAALGAVLGKVDAATGQARAAVLDAMRGIHGVLDDGQRERLADMIERSSRGSWRRGPYR